MGVLVATSHFDLLSAPAADWGSEPSQADYTVAVRKVRGSLSGVSGVSDGQGNVVYAHKLTLDPCPLEESMLVRDAYSGAVYRVLDTPQRSTLIPATVATVARANSVS